MFKSAMAAVSVLAFSGAAMAGSLNESFNLGNVFFGAHATAFGDDPVEVFTVNPTQNPNPIIGIRFSFDYDEVNANGNPALDTSWASDLGVVLRFDNTLYGFAGTFRYLGALAGAYGQAAALAFVDVLDIWSFNGLQSDNPGFYSHEFFFENPIMKPESITISMTDTWNGNTLYGNFTLELIKIPAPGAAGLFGLAGLAAIRRRR